MKNQIDEKKKHIKINGTCQVLAKEYLDQKKNCQDISLIVFYGIFTIDLYVIFFKFFLRGINIEFKNVKKKKFSIYKKEAKKVSLFRVSCFNRKYLPYE